MDSQQRRKVLCPRCGKYGFISRRWVKSTYYPQYNSIAVTMMQIWSEKHAKNPDDKKAQATYKVWSVKVKGNRYRGEHKTGLINSANVTQDFDKISCYRITYGKYLQYYVAHYDPEKYEKQMTDYRAGRRKSRPNGRRECKLRINRDLKRFAMRKLPSFF
jgi:hypothetical protein